MFMKIIGKKIGNLRGAIFAYVMFIRSFAYCVTR